jgi:fatty-acyl-CoA synthase
VKSFAGKVKPMEHQMKVAFRVGDFLDRAANVYGDRIGVIDEPGPYSLGELTYQQMERRARGMARKLEDLGLQVGDRIAIVSPNSARFLLSFFGTGSYGRVLVPINFRLNAEEIRYIIEHSGARVLLVDPEYASLVEHIPIEHRFVMNGMADASLFEEINEGGLQPTPWSADEDATATINYTSGTTARPKGVQLTHRNLWTNAVTFGWHSSVSERDVYLHTLPMFHCNGWGQTYAVTGMGGRHIIIRKINGEDILARIEQHQINFACGAPAVVSMTLDAAEKRRATGRAVPGRDRVRIIVAGAPPPSKTIERVEIELGWEFIQIYGLTETAPLLTINRRVLEHQALDPATRAKLLSRAGVPAIGVQIKIDEEGEICARANQVFEGYWRQPEETNAAIQDGYFHTGDGGYAEGPYVVISDRKKDVIITGGENVSSIEVEDCLFQHPSVAECAVIGVPDEKWGETIKALVVLRRDTPQSSERELIEFCRARMAHFKCPTSVEIREELARTATGKLQKFKLRAPYWAGREKSIN